MNNEGAPLDQQQTQAIGLPIAQLKAEFFRALAHPARVRSLELLVESERTVGEIAEAVGLELSHLSQQLGILRRAGIVVTRRVGSTIYYSVRDERMSQLLAIAKQMLVTGLQESQQLLVELKGEDDTATRGN